MTPAPKRRWFQWSLRTLFVVVTVFGVWLGWNVNLVHRRRAMIDSNLLGRDDAGWMSQFGRYNVRMVSAQKPSARHARMPTIRAWLGDVPIPLIIVPRKANADSLRSLFPESKILYIGDPKLAKSLEQYRSEQYDVAD